MKKIHPYKNIEEAMANLDNGGRFYNLLTKADDGIISSSELGKVGGIFNDKQKMILFLELSISHLPDIQKEQLISKLSEELQNTYFKYKPQELLASEAQAKGIIASNAMITGIPKLTAATSDFKGFILIPVIVGKMTTFTMIPIIDKYDIYEIRDHDTDTSFLIAHAKGTEKLPHKKIKVAGVLKELKSDKKEKTASKKFLEAVYYMEVNEMR
ncbi:hypothetical protein ACG2LH_12165 [Zhouia sp. PK063]|uniref:hypothetical protein n=1 Tax=Zhouia sp. PK063 TaxID=3373602 RepID=UPI003787FE24